MSKNKILCYIATLGTLLATTGCTTTYVVRDDFRLPQARTENVQNKERCARKVVVPTVIEAKPLVIYAPAPVYRRHIPAYGGPTAGTLLGNTLRGLEGYYREY